MWFLPFICYFLEGGEVSFVIGFLGHNLCCMPWIFPLASYK